VEPISARDISPISASMNNHGQMDWHYNYSDSICFHFIENPEDQVCRILTDLMQAADQRGNLLCLTGASYFLQAERHRQQNVVNVDTDLTSVL
jgi:hypothetical protein